MNITEYQSLFDTEEKRKAALNDLASLRHHPGWTLLMQIYNLLIKNREQEILENEELMEVQRKDLKIQRKDFVFSRDLPQDVIQDLTAYQENQEQTDDPY